MHYVKLPHMDDRVSVFDICQAHAQLESDYNKGGIVIERPSNRRRMASTGCQLSRMQFDPGCRWVDICSDPDEQDDPGDDDVRDIYLINVVRWGLPMDAEMHEFVQRRFVPAFLDQLGYKPPGVTSST